MRVSARREAREKGLAGMFQTHRGFTIHANGERVGRVGYQRGIGGELPMPWYWYASCRGLFRNTAAETTYYATAEEARDACVAWMKSLPTPTPSVTPKEEP